jgi:beta-lactamase regulating signal transducer with metallopeptidase domain
MIALTHVAWIVRAGWSLLHFLWQGTLIAIFFAAVRACIGRSLTARARYTIACAALATMTLAPLLTFAASGAITVPAAAWRPDAGALERALPYVVACWLAGAMLFSLRLIAGLRFTATLKTSAVEAPPAQWQSALDNLIERIGVSRPVRLLVSSLADVPMVIGWLRPVVLMPVSALAGLPLDQVEALLAHELAHVWRNDYLVNILQNVAEALLFYHPAVWWISAQIRIERELCCDDVAVSASRGVAVYVRALADLDAHRRARRNTALAADGGSLVERVRRLLMPAKPASNSVPAAGAAWVLSLLWLAGIGAATVHGAPPFSHPAAARVFGARRVAAVPRPFLDQPPPLSARALVTPLPLLMFDPFFAPPQTPAPAVSSDQQPSVRNVEGMRVFRTDLIYVQQPIEVPEGAHLKLTGDNYPPVFENAFDTILRYGEAQSVNVSGPAGRFSIACPVMCASFETWVESIPGNYAESILPQLAGVRREDGRVSLVRVVGDDLRKVYIAYSVEFQALNDPGAVQVTFHKSIGAVPADARLPAGATLTSPDRVPLLEVMRAGDVLAIELYADRRTGRRIVDYIHVGQGSPIELRTGVARNAQAEDAGFRVVRPRVSVNGVPVEPGAVSSEVTSRVMWAYVPGHGRFTFSLRPQPGFEEAGELAGNTLALTQGSYLLRIQGAGRIATEGSGIYRVYARQDPLWQPADRADRARFMIGAAEN